MCTCFIFHILVFAKEGSKNKFCIFTWMWYFCEFLRDHRMTESERYVGEFHTAFSLCCAAVTLWLSDFELSVREMINL